MHEKNPEQNEEAARAIEDFTRIYDWMETTLEIGYVEDSKTWKNSIANLEDELQEAYD